MSVQRVLSNLFGVDWFNAMRTYLMSQDFANLGQWLIEERKHKNVYPVQQNVFKAFKLTPYENVKIVFLSDKPYVDKNYATGLSFGVNTEMGVGLPSPLKTMICALESDLDILCLDFDYSLEGWSKQGVLMLNTALTVEKGKASSHLKAWNPFIIQVINAINRKNDNVVYVLFGENAQHYEKYLDEYSTRVIKAPHPASDAQSGFYGSKIFSKCNSILYMLEKEEINWNIK